MIHSLTIFNGTQHDDIQQNVNMPCHLAEWHYADIQQNDTQYDNILYNDTQHDGIQHITLYH